MPGSGPPPTWSPASGRDASLVALGFKILCRCCTVAIYPHPHPMLRTPKVQPPLGEDVSVPAAELGQTFNPKLLKVFWLEAQSYRFCSSSPSRLSFSQKGLYKPSFLGCPQMPKLAPLAASFPSPRGPCHRDPAGNSPEHVATPVPRQQFP